MNVIETELPGVLLIEPKVHGDARGFFIETYQVEKYRELAGIELPFVQDNHSRSKQGVLRGIHSQRTHPQGKLVRVVTGEVFDVAVDIDPASETFGTWVGVTLSDSNGHQLWIPPEYAHGFVVLSDVADFVYKCTDFYHPEDESGLIWNDPEVNVSWPIPNPTLSKKDLQLPSLAQLRDVI